jgi:hypothetical protein
MVIGPFCAKLGAVSAVLLSPSLAFGEVPTEAIEKFLDGAQTVITELELDAPNAETIVTIITAILNHAKPVALAYSSQHQQCAEQLERMIELYPEIDAWRAQQIRRDIERGAALPQAEGCYPARDIVAHPAIVRAVSRSGIPPAQKPRLIRKMNEASFSLCEPRKP